LGIKILSNLLEIEKPQKAIGIKVLSNMLEIGKIKKAIDIKVLYNLLEIGKMQKTIGKRLIKVHPMSRTRSIYFGRISCQF